MNADGCFNKIFLHAALNGHFYFSRLSNVNVLPYGINEPYVNLAGVRDTRGKSTGSPKGRIILLIYHTRVNVVVVVPVRNTCSNPVGLNPQNDRIKNDSEPLWWNTDKWRRHQYAKGHILDQI